MASPTRARSWLVLRWTLLVGGVVANAVAFTGLVIALDRGWDIAPWWRIGLLGLVAVLVAFATPSSRSPARP